MKDRPADGEVIDLSWRIVSHMHWSSLDESDGQKPECVSLELDAMRPQLIASMVLVSRDRLYQIQGTCVCVYGFEIATTETLA